MATEGAPDRTDVQPFAWLTELPPYNERAMRMEALVARVRVMVMLVNTFALLFLLDTSGMQMRWVWGIVAFSWAWSLPMALLEPYRRWRVFRGSLLTAAIDSLSIAVFVAITGAHESPFYLLYFLSIMAVAMRFELRQTVLACAFAVITYGFVYFATWDPGLDALAQFLLRGSYMFFAAVGTGHLAREENRRAEEVIEVERINAEHAKLITRNERAARLDKLTGLLNRGYFEKQAVRELRKAKANQASMTVLFMDMDHLKRVNDELGHDTGDRVLRQVGAVLRHGIRSNDSIGRYGGDEFVALLPNVTREAAWDRADQLIEGVQALNEGVPDHLHIGLSIGIATYPTDAQDYAGLVKLADQAMYLAKREGGSRVRTANDLRLFWEDVSYSA